VFFSIDCGTPLRPPLSQRFCFFNRSLWLAGQWVYFMVEHGCICTACRDGSTSYNLQRLSERDGLLSIENPAHGINQCIAILNNNLARRIDRSNPLQPEIV